MLFEILAELKCKPAATLMIGDTCHDALMARQARIPFLAVGHGAHTARELNNCNAELLTESLLDYFRKNY